jgi:DNA repair protein RadA/Sms
MVLAVLDARCGVGFGGHDIYLTVAGGLRIGEPAADLAAAAALVSALTGVPVPRDTVLFGEIGLSGGVRPVPQPEARLREAAKLGFSRAILPAQMQRRDESGMSLRQVSGLGELVPDLAEA